VTAEIDALAPLAAFERAMALHRSGRLDEADVIYRRILDAEPRHFDALHFLGVIAGQRGDKETAVRLIDEALAINPRSAPAFSNRGNILKDLRRFADALASYDSALALQPDFADAFNNRGNALRALGRFDDALASYDRAIELRPDYSHAHYNRGNVLADLKRHDDAIASFDRALGFAPANAEIHLVRGNAFTALKRWDEALACYDTVIALRRDHVDAQCNRGVALRHLGRHDEAIACYDRAIALIPDRPEAYCNKGTALLDLRRPAEAIECFKRALQIRSGYSDARLNLAHAQLMMGDFTEAWVNYEARWLRTGLADADLPPPAPFWRADDDTAGRTVLLHAEQGMGDTLQFCRYASLVAARGARVILEVQPELTALMASLAGPRLIHAKGKPRPAFDYQCGLMSLPLAFATRLDTIPADVPYLGADAERLVAWRRRLGASTRPRLGVVWSGQVRHSNDHNRSIPLAAFVPLAGLGMEIVSLQNDVRASDADAMRRLDVRNFAAHLSDFAETAALVSLMDVVVAVDTSVAHLAGALGKPLAILLPFAPDWRWMLEREDSPWYPTARLYRQPRRGDWVSVIERVAAEVREAVFGRHRESMASARAWPQTEIRPIFGSADTRSP
jgi:tetratricopeptide (TPR) repeat protein